MNPTPPPLNTYPLALLGFGNVGRAFAELLLEKQAHLEEALGLRFKVVGIATHRHGMAVDPEGFSLEQALESYRSGVSLDDLSQNSVGDVKEFLHICGAEALVETTPVDYQTGQPAIGYLRTALERGMHAVTANKGPVVHGYRELTDLARSRGLSFFFESAVMDGAPVFSIARCGLPGAEVTGFQGILNSTTNLILSRMEEGESFDQAVAYTQSIGIAETDPSGDVDGWDAAVKVAALSTVLMNLPLTPDQVDRSGIREITREQVSQAAAQQKRWKLVCRAQRDSKHPQGVRASVEPRLVLPDSPLYNVMGTSAILQIESDVLGRLSLIEENPSPQTTAYGLLADLLNAFQESP